MVEINRNAGQGVGEIKNAVVGSGQKITDAITALEEEGLVRSEKVGMAKKCYPVTQNDAERYRRASKGEQLAFIVPVHSFPQGNNLGMNHSVLALGGD